MYCGVSLCNEVKYTLISFSFCNVNGSSCWLVGGPGHVGGFHRDNVLLKTWRGKLLASGG